MDPQVALLNFLDPGQDWSRNCFVGGVDGEHFRHVALAFFEEHHRAVVGAFLAELVVKSLVEGAHLAFDAGVEFGCRQHDFYFGGFVGRQS